jgi:hypothetical protein
MHISNRLRAETFSARITVRDTVMYGDRSGMARRNGRACVEARDGGGTMNPALQACLSTVDPASGAS